MHAGSQSEDVLRPSDTSTGRVRHSPPRPLRQPSRVGRLGRVIYPSLHDNTSVSSATAAPHEERILASTLTRDQPPRRIRFRSPSSIGPTWSATRWRKGCEETPWDIGGVRLVPTIRRLRLRCARRHTQLAHRHQAQNDRRQVRLAVTRPRPQYDQEISCSPVSLFTAPHAKFYL